MCACPVQEPGDADVQAALGVLHSLARQFERAGEAFRAALTLRPKVQQHGPAEAHGSMPACMPCALQPLHAALAGCCRPARCRGRLGIWRGDVVG